MKKENKKEQAEEKDSDLLNKSIEFAKENNLNESKVLTSKKKEESDAISNDDTENNDNEKDSASLYKFKDAKELERAYRELESEFTKKCQRIKELEAENNSQRLPVYDDADFKLRIEEFIKNYPNAKAYATEISEMIKNDEELKVNHNCLELAFAKLMGNYDRTNILKDPEFLKNNVLSNEEIKRLIVEDYLSNLRKVNLPPLIDETYGGFRTAKQESPKTLEEASKLAYQMLRNY